MPEYLAPGVYVEEVHSAVHPISGVPTSITAFVGRAPTGPMDEPVAVGSWLEFERQFGGLAADYPLGYCVRDFFHNGGRNALVVRSADNGDVVANPTQETGLYALEKAEIFNLLCLPPTTRDGDTSPAAYQEALAYCVRRRAILIVDPPLAWGANAQSVAAITQGGLSSLGISGTDSRNAAFYFPRIVAADPLANGELATVVPCGAVAGLIARTDEERGIWRTPAGSNATLRGVTGLQYPVSDAEQALLNPVGVNCLRSFTGSAPIIWGARTMASSDPGAHEERYLAVRRLVLWIAQSIASGTKWAVFEDNAAPLWAKIRLNVEAFMHKLFRDGAFAGRTPQDCYFVKCDLSTMTTADILNGYLIFSVGFAATKPAEFTVIEIQIQLAKS
jgi:phage tail sheath protein FI